MVKNLAYHTGEADTYNEFSDDEFIGDKVLFSNLRQIGTNGKIMLDFGCGNARIEKRLLDTGASRVVCIEPSKSMVDAARENINTFTADYRDKTEIICSSSEKLPFKNDMFDIAIAHFVLHYIPETKNTLQELYRTIKSGGYLIATVNDFTFKNEHRSLYNTTIPLILKKRLRILSLAKSANEILENAIASGFSIEHTEPFSTESASIDDDYQHKDKVTYNNLLIVAKKS